MFMNKCSSTFADNECMFMNKDTVNGCVYVNKYTSMSYDVYFLTCTSNFSYLIEHEQHHEKTCCMMDIICLLKSDASGAEL